MTFVDSNVWLYSLIDDVELGRHTTATAILASIHRPVVSPQVINEVCFNLRRKAGLPESRIRETIVAFHMNCVVTPFTEASMLRASALRERHAFSYWDSQIAACALQTGCSTLLSEDMQHGLIVDGILTVQNPFT